jgi:hypothetical protein
MELQEAQKSVIDFQPPPFCPTCGSTIYFENEASPGIVAVAIGNFADPNFPAPIISVWEKTRHPWVSLPPDTKRMEKQG